MDYTNMIVEELSKYKSIEKIKELLDDIDVISNMINNKEYKRDLVNNILKKYERYFNFLSNLEFSVNNRQSARYSKSNEIEYLYSVRYSLLRVGVIILAKELGKEIINENLVSNDKVVFEMLCNIIDNKNDK